MDMINMMLFTFLANRISGIMQGSLVALLLSLNRHVHWLIHRVTRV